MELKIERLDVVMSGNSEAIMTHRGVEIKWSSSLFEKTSFTGEFDIFAEINGYWSYLPMETQDKIFDVYQRIRAVFDDVWVMSDMTKALYPLVEELYTYTSLPGLYQWIQFYGNLFIPPTVKESFKESFDTIGTRDRTYIQADYRWLVALSVAMRVMVPVWGEFISLTGRETGTNFKEYYAFKLLAKSPIATCEPMERLRVYVSASLPPDKSVAAAIFGGISSEDFPTWVLGLVVVRRLSVGDVRGIDQTSSLVSFIYKYIGQKVKGHENSFIGTVKDKPTEGTGAQDAENNLSKLEGYKVKQGLSAGHIAMMGHYAKNTTKIARALCPDIDLLLLEQSLASVQQLRTAQIARGQVILTQWVLARQIQPRGIPYLSKTQIMEVIAVAQACLWHRGHIELAGLVSATALSNEQSYQLSGVEHRKRIPKETVEVLQTLYPFARRPSGKQKATRQPSVAVTAIEKMDEHFSEFDWRLTVPTEWVNQITGTRANRRYSTPHDIQVKLANLAVQLGQRTF